MPRRSRPKAALLAATALSGLLGGLGLAPQAALADSTSAQIGTIER